MINSYRIHNYCLWKYRIGLQILDYQILYVDLLTRYYVNKKVFSLVVYIYAVYPSLSKAGGSVSKCNCVSFTSKLSLLFAFSFDACN